MFLFKTYRFRIGGTGEVSYKTWFVNVADKEAIEETLKQTTAFSTKDILSKKLHETFVCWVWKSVDQQQEDLLQIRMIDWLDADAKIDLVGVKEGIFKDDMLILFPISSTYSDET